MNGEARRLVGVANARLARAARSLVQAAQACEDGDGRETLTRMLDAELDVAMAASGLKLARRVAVAGPVVGPHAWPLLHDEETAS